MPLPVTVKSLCRSLSLVIATSALLAPAAKADPVFVITYLAPGVQTPQGITPYYQTFDSSGFVNGTTDTTTFNGSPITGTYSGSYKVLRADYYGGAGGTGSYFAETNGSSATLTLSEGVNYFGLWFSALDRGNLLQFYNDGNLVETFNAASFIQGVGLCNGSNLYCGNPNSGGDPGEQFSYINFYDMSSTFNKVVFTEICCGNFESDNNAVALVDQSPTGNVLDQSSTPEPSSLLLLATGLCALAMVVRRRGINTRSLA